MFVTCRSDSRGISLIMQGFGVLTANSSNEMTAIATSKMVRRISLIDGDNHRDTLVICDLVKVAIWQFITCKQTHEVFYFQICLVNIKFRSKVVLYSLY